MHETPVMTRPQRQKQPVFDAGRFRLGDAVVLALYGAMMILGVAGALLLIPAYRDLFATESLELFSVNLVSYAVLFVAAMMVVAPKLFESFRTFRYYPWAKVSLIPGLWFASLMLTAGIAAAMGVDPAKSENQLIIEGMTREVPFVTMLVTTAIMGPLVEEYIFRHLLIGKLSRRWPLWLCVVLSVLSFAGLHFIGTMSFDPVAALPYLMLGTVLSLAYVFTGRSLAYAYVLHAFNNAVSLAIAYTLLPALGL